MNALCNLQEFKNIFVIFFVKLFFIFYLATYNFCWLLYVYINNIIFSLMNRGHIG